MTHGTWRRPLQALVVAALAMDAGGASGSRALAQARVTPSPVQAVPVPHEVHARVAPLKAPKSALVEFDVSPFPYEGLVPRTSRPFFDVTDDDGRRGHSSRAGVLWEDATYSDRRALLFMPKGFDVRRPRR